jgi:hypothetical protein
MNNPKIEIFTCNNNNGKISNLNEIDISLEANTEDTTKACNEAKETVDRNNNNNNNSTNNDENDELNKKLISLNIASTQEASN